MHYELTDEFDVSASLEQAWAFFSNASNLPAITPPWLRFEIRTPESVVIEKDAIFDYTIRLMRIPLKWKTRILDWQPPARFVDLQIKGPYSLWHHEHRFTPLAGGGIRCFDRVIYQLPLGLLGRLTHAAMVKRQLREVFQYRRRVIGQRLGGFKPVQADVQIRRLC